MIPPNLMRASGSLGKVNFNTRDIILESITMKYDGGYKKVTRLQDIPKFITIQKPLIECQIEIRTIMQGPALDLVFRLIMNSQRRVPLIILDGFVLGWFLPKNLETKRSGFYSVGARYHSYVVTLVKDPFVVSSTRTRTKRFFKKAGYHLFG